jgi:hypothetical protein
MPYSPDIYTLLVDYIKELYAWDGSHRRNAEKLANMVYTRGEKAEMTSVRKYLNVIHTFYTFQKFNPAYSFDPENDFVVHLLIIKEAWQPLYENMIREALKKNTKMKNLTDYIITIGKNEGWVSFDQEHFLDTYFRNSTYPFHEEILANWLMKYPTLA